jgi:hypothetical protein
VVAKYIWNRLFGKCGGYIVFLGRFRKNIMWQVE